MTGTISFGGIGSGLDTEGIVLGLVDANSGRLDALRGRAKTTDSAIATMSSISKHLSSLSSAASALATVRDASAYGVTSSDSAVAASVTGAAFPGSFDVDVLSLAKEQRTYSKAFDSSVEALSQTGTITIEVAGESAQINVQASDSLESIAGSINASSSGLRVSASVFYDGSQYRLQIRGLDTGAANALTFTEAGTNLDLNGDGVDPQGGSTYQAAADAQVRIDGYTVTRSTNQIVGAIPGVTLAITQETTEAVRVTVASDAEELQNDLQSVVDSFNTIVGAIHSASGFGDMVASNDELAGDYALRTVSDRLSGMVYSPTSGQGTYTMLAEVGLSLDSSGALTLDAQKLQDAVGADPDGVAEILAEKMAALDGLVDDMTDPAQGVFALRNEALSSQLDELNERADREQTWLDRYAESLRKRFTAMDVAVGVQQAAVDQLLNMFG